MGYDCSSPRDLKIWDASTRCKDGVKRKMEEQGVTIVQSITEQWLTGFKCSVNSVGGAGGDIVNISTGVQLNLKPIAVPGETYITEFEKRYQYTAKGGVHCEGGATMLDGSIHNGIITHAVYVVTINFRDRRP